MGNMDDYCDLTKRASKYGGPEEYIKILKEDQYESGFETGYDVGYETGSEEAFADGIKAGYKEGNFNGLMKGTLGTAVAFVLAAIPTGIYFYQKNKVNGMEFEVVKKSKDKHGNILNPGDTFTVYDVGFGKKWKKVKIFINRDYTKLYEVSSYFLARVSDFGKYFMI